MNNVRDSKWSESIAVGSENFIDATKKLLGIKEKGRKKINGGEGYELREPPVSSNTNFENTYYWEGHLLKPIR